ncbi:serine/threonine protein phosphatase [Streptomyces lasiicapitis]|uniref:serine/threonine protein phosphatase n=1 Tax=Streptomyces lasiicapitis TaxID=1923961 RepID=UPI0036479072
MWTERVAGRGEDAEPFVAHHWESRQGLLAVFDGSGGSGAAPVWQAPDGTSRTGAWVGARVARLAVDCWFREVARDGERAGHDSLHEYLEYFLSKAPQRRSKISGTMRRQLPTTLAGIHYRLLSEHHAQLQALWAGDSRAYALTTGAGLRVLTRDHTPESDALELLRTDPPMTNVVCADREFEISAQLRTPFALPCVLVAATDGFFGYVHTPGDFELVLLQTLSSSCDEADWADRLRRTVNGYTADDASLALIVLGHSDFDGMRQQFMPRLHELKTRHTRIRPYPLMPTVSAPSTGTETPPPAQDASARFRAWQDETWQSYRASYESLLPPAPEEHA